VAENDGFVLFCPYASRFPFEMAIYPKKHGPNFSDCTAHDLALLAEILRSGLTRLSQVLEHPGYNIMLHTAPLNRPGPDGTTKYASTQVDYCWHMEIVPRMAMLAGFEVGLGSYMNSIFPEDAAQFLRGEVVK
jgi:UDPglucose--hexose-1-phosphate uridylyltransferase